MRILLRDRPPHGPPLPKSTPHRPPSLPCLQCTRDGHARPPLKHRRVVPRKKKKPRVTGAKKKTFCSSTRGRAPAPPGGAPTRAPRGPRAEPRVHGVTAPRATPAWPGRGRTAQLDAQQGRAQPGVEAPHRHRARRRAPMHRRRRQVPPRRQRARRRQLPHRPLPQGQPPHHPLQAPRSPPPQPRNRGAYGKRTPPGAPPLPYCAESPPPLPQRSERVLLTCGRGGGQCENAQ